MAKMKAATPTMTEATREPTNSQATNPIKPPVATEPTRRPSVARSRPLMMNAATEIAGLEF